MSSPVSPRLSRKPTQHNFADGLKDGFRNELRDQLDLFEQEKLQPMSEHLRLHFKADLDEALRPILDRIGIEFSPPASPTPVRRSCRAAVRKSMKKEDVDPKQGRKSMVINARKSLFINDAETETAGDGISGTWRQLLMRRHGGCKLNRSTSSLSSRSYEKESPRQVHQPVPEYEVLPDFASPEHGNDASNVSNVENTEHNDGPATDDQLVICSDAAESWIDVDSWVARSRYLIEDDQQLASLLDTGQKASSRSVAVPSKAHKSSLAALRKVVGSPKFEQLIGFLVILNSILLGFEAGDVRKFTNQYPFLNVLDAIFCLVFIVEWIMRLVIYNRNFCTMDGWYWNLFDTIIVALMLVEESQILLEWLGFHANENVLRILRLLRLARIARLLRVVRLFEDLRTITTSVTQATGALGWTLCLLFMMIFSFGVILTDLVSDSRSESKELFYWFGSLGRTMLTLFECLLGGVSWDIVVVVLMKQVSTSTALSFCVYMAVGLFIILNVVTGLFVEKAMRTAREESDIAMAMRLGEMFKNVAREAGTSQIDWALFERGLQTSDMQEYLKAVNIDVSEARSLFDLVDLNRDGVLEIDEIVQGCLRLKGDAKALDLTLLMHHMITMHEESLETTKIVESKLILILVHLGIVDPADDEQEVEQEEVIDVQKKEFNMLIGRALSIKEEPEEIVDMQKSEVNLLVGPPNCANRASDYGIP